MERMNDLDQALGDSEHVKKLCIDYKELYEKECKVRFQLEDECDLLAVENIRLQNQVNELKLKLSLIPLLNTDTEDSTNDNINSLSKTYMVEIEPVDVNAVCKVEQKNSTTSLPSSPSIVIKDACNQKNVISLSFCDNNESILCAGADNSIHLFRNIKRISSTIPNIDSNSKSSSFHDYLTTIQGTELSHWQYKLTAPVTHITSFQNITACSLFDGSTALLTFPIDITDTSGTNIAMIEPMIEIIKDHTKRNIACVFSPDGLLFATASTDKSIHIYHKRIDGETKIGWRLDKYVTLYFETTPEAIVFAPVTVTACAPVSVTTIASPNTQAQILDTESSSKNNNNSNNNIGSGDNSSNNSNNNSSDRNNGNDNSSSNNNNNNSSNRVSSSASWELIIGVRDSSSLIYFNCQNSLQIPVSLNEKAWDTHPSFVPLQLALSPNHQYLCVATDKNYHIVYKLGTNERIRLLAEHTCNEYGKPSICWDNTSQYIYSTTEYEFSIYIYSLQSEKVIKKLSGHKGSIRALTYCHSSSQASFKNTINSSSSSSNSHSSSSGSSSNSHSSSSGSTMTSNNSKPNDDNDDEVMNKKDDSFMLASCSFDKSIIIRV